MAKRCNHKTTRFDWGRDTTGAEVAISRWCNGCGEQLGLGPSNDEPAEVQREMSDAQTIAAGITAGYSEADLWDGGKSSLPLGESPDDWSWDPSRPIAEQGPSDLDAIEYEVTRSAEPDCRDEDDVHAANCDTITDDAFPCNCEARVTWPAPIDSDPVCSCHGDALRSERCGGES